MEKEVSDWRVGRDGREGNQDIDKECVRRIERRGRIEVECAGNVVRGMVESAEEREVYPKRQRV